MEPFLKILAEHVYQKFRGELEDKLLLFPNRRAGLFFRKYYAAMTRKPGFMPEIVTIGDFMSRISGLQQADPLELSFHIYYSYRKFVPQPESFDDFYPWGEMLISDYNDVDRYMVDAGSLFKNITDLKTIDNVFDFLDEGQKTLIMRFWKNFDGHKLSGQKESFLAIWNLMHPVYENFRSVLLKDKLGYEGLIYRTVAEEIITNTSFTLPWEHILVCGFNALSRSEEKLFLHLRNTSQATFYWDYDFSYVNDEVHEAGKFLRRNLRLFPGDPDFNPGYDNMKEKRKVRVYSLPSDVLQAKQLFSILEAENNPRDGNEIIPDANGFHKTSVIFGDESLLPATLTSLPDSVEYLNITMGFPLAQTPVFSFLDAILLLQQFSERRRKDQLFYYRDVLSILDHQYIKSFYSEKVTDFIEGIHKANKIYLDPAEFCGDELLSSIFRKIDKVEEIMEYLSGLLQKVLISFPPDDTRFRLEKEYIFLINTRINKLKNLLDVHSLPVSAEGFIRLFRKVMHDFTIPFEGEPLRGTQFMGILESRLLDFHNIIFLSMNEGVIPAGSSAYSFIPANLRFAFGMPVREDKDAIYAYYFYRLLQRAKNIHILYNSKTEGGSSGEPSRYIYQLDYLSGWEIEKFTKSFRVHEREPVSIRIEKNRDVMSLLHEYTRPDSEKYLSPSALTTYMDCPLRFYFSYLAGIREEDEASEEIDASGFGSLYHKSMELIYSDLKEKTVTSEDILFLQKPEQVKLHVEQAFREEFHRDRDSKKKIVPEGR
ncbi:MAG: PD-(D/E)XK nuclease family protein, partial [Bacteroidales bacterium]|nr:PD-(D/E)XK nuclease family protein [Bacteroidales bacterium]